MSKKPCTRECLAASEFSKVLICRECGVVHLCVQNMSLRLEVAGFLSFADTMAEASHQVRADRKDKRGYVDDIYHPGFGKTGWPAPEIGENLNRDELGNLHLSHEEEKAIIAFLKTLTDGYPKWGHDRRIPPWSPAPFAQPQKWLKADYPMHS